jgi:hypothetical protein
MTTYRNMTQEQLTKLILEITLPEQKYQAWFDKDYNLVIAKEA